MAEEIKKRDYQTAVYRTGMYSEGLHPVNRTPFFDPTEGMHPVLFFAKNMVGTNTLCIHRDALIQHRFDERFHFFEDTHLLLRVLADFPFFQIQKYTSVYRVHRERSSYTIYEQPNPAASIENNVEAIKDLFDNYKVALGPYLSEDLRNIMISRKYMDHAAESLVAGKLKTSVNCFRKAVAHDLQIKYWRRYLGYLPKLPLKFLFDYPPAH